MERDGKLFYTSQSSQIELLGYSPRQETVSESALSWDQSPEARGDKNVQIHVRNKRKHFILGL